MNDKMDNSLRESRIEAFRHLISARCYLRVTGDDELADELDDMSDRLEDRIRTNEQVDTDQ